MMSVKRKNHPAQTIRTAWRIVLLLTVSAAPAGAQQKFDVDLQILGRGEIRRGGMVDPKAEEPVIEKANFLMSRSRLMLTYERPHLEVKLTPQHAGIWGQSGNGSFNLYEGWVKLKSSIGLYAQVGRQALAYDDERIIGSDDWAMTGLTHDVLRMAYEGYGHKGHVILAYNQNSENTTGGSFYKDGSQPYKTMQTLWYHYDVPRVPIGASLLFMNIGMQGGDSAEDGHTEYQQLLGGYAKFEPKPFSAEASYYKQMGHDENGMKIDAWMMSFKAQVDVMDKLAFKAGYDYMSGDKYFAVPRRGGIGSSKPIFGLVQHDVLRGFNPIYGSHHKFYGAMDFFFVTTYVNGFTPGLQNLYGGASYSPVKWLDLSATYHYLAITADLPNVDKSLGHELELEGTARIMKDVKLTVGYTYMTGTETMKYLKRASSDGKLSWGWVTLVVSPQLFSTKW